MDRLTESYGNLLHYLEDQEKLLKSKPVPKKLEKKVEVKQVQVVPLTEPKIEDFLDIKPPVMHSSKKSSSRGFDVRQFELMMRSKLIEEHKIQQSYERPYISVGELGGCMRANYYSRMKYQVDVNDLFKFSYLYLIQQIGKKVHDIFQELYNFTEIEKTVVSERYKVKGRTDAIKENNLFELKTFDMAKMGAKTKYEEKDYDQATTYTCILNNEYGYKIDNITIIYVPRDLKRIFPFDLKPDENRAKLLLERGPVLLGHITKHIVPDPIGASNDHCKFCLYKNYCSKDAYSKITPPFMVGKEKPKEDKVAFLL